MDDVLEFIMLKIATPIAIVLLTLLLLAVPFIIYVACTEGAKPVFSLKKDEWECSKWIPITATTYALVGKVMVPITGTHNECVQWSRK